MKIKIKKLYEGAKMPSRGTKSAAGFDLYVPETTFLFRDIPQKVRTGLAFEIPEGYVGVVYSRSSSARDGIVITPLLVDSDYRGEVYVLATYLGEVEPDNPRKMSGSLKIEAGERIAQMRLEKLIDTEYEWAETLSDTERGTGGYGSTGR